MLVGAFGAVFELLGQQRVEQQGEGAGELCGFEVGGEQEQRVGEPVELAAWAAGDGLKPHEQVEEAWVVIGQAGVGTEDSGRPPVFRTARPD